MLTMLMLPFLSLLLKKETTKTTNSAPTALASSGRFGAICTSHVYQRLIPTESDLDGLLHWTWALPDLVIKPNDAHTELRAGVCTAGDTRLAFSL